MSNALFIPGYRDGQAPWGAWTWHRMIANPDWTENGDHNDADMAAIVLNPSQHYEYLQDTVGALGYTFGSETDYPEVYALGYPGEGYQRTDLDAERMMLCFGNTEDFGPWNPFDNRLKMDCDMGQGASGGPMVMLNDQNSAQIIGTISHHLSNPVTFERINDDQLSSQHGANASIVINTVNGV